MTKITVAIPTHRRPIKLRRALDSALAQSRAPDCIVVGDDASDVTTREVVEGLGDSRVVYVDRPSGGMAANWDFVLRYSADGYVALLEDDNYWHPWHLAEFERTLETLGEVGIYHAPHEEVWEGSDGSIAPYRRYHAPWWSSTPVRVSAAEVVFDSLVCGSINASTVVVDRSLVDRLPVFDDRYPMGMDTLMWARAAMRGTTGYGTELSVVYTYDGTNVSTGEVSSGRARTQARAARRLVLTEALADGVVALDDLRTWLHEEAAPAVAGILPMIADRSSPPEVRALVPAVLKARPELHRHANRYLRLARYTGPWALRFTSDGDRLLQLLRASRSGIPRRKVNRG